jgi:anti-sigma regulatory factor (Ser/Thr protein kinase)
MNAMEHGNNFNPMISVAIRLFVTPEAVTVRITDRGGGKPIAPPVLPDLDAKLEGLQSPRGWGLFLIQNMVDKVTTTSDEVHHTVELTMKRTS